MNAEPSGVDLGSEPDELVDAASLMRLAIEGVARSLEEVVLSESEANGLRFGARLVLDRAERIAAALDERQTRWMTGLPPAYAGEEAKAEAAP